MIPEQHLLIILLNKGNYRLYKDEVPLKHLKETSRELSYLYLTLFELHDKYPDRSLSIDELTSYFWVKYPEADQKVFGALLESLRSLQINEDVGRGVLEAVMRRKAALKLSEVSYRVAQGLEDASVLQALLSEVDHPQVSDTGVDVFVSDNLEYLIEQTYSESGLRWRLDCLNKSLGSLRAGDFGFIFARPETGKTTFLASEVTSFLTTADKPIIWFNNEEQGHKVMLRIYQAFFGVTSDQLLANPAKFRSAFIEQTGGRLKLYDSATISRADVERVVSKYSPCLVIYDQLTKITGFSADRNDLELGAKFQWARELAKNSHAGIGVSQADGHAEGVRYLTMEHVANAKTAIQAEADWILGIGKTHQEDSEYIRFLNICKNKLLGDKDSISDLRHGKFEVLIKPEIARYADIIKFN